MERRLAAAIERKEDPPDTTQISMVRNLAQELSTVEALGRITVEADPAILSTRPELDMLLEKGDRIYIPKRQITVRVNNWNHTPIFIPPGSTIIVPQDPKPFSFLEGAKEIGQILSNLAITAVFIDDIRD